MDFASGVLRWLGSRFSQKPWDTWLGDGNFSVLRALARRQGVAFAATLTALKATSPKNRSERAVSPSDVRKA